MNAARPPAGPARSTIPGTSSARATPAELAELADLGVATVYEASGRAGLVGSPLLQVIGGTSVAGPARIAACGQGGNRAVHEVMAYLDTGDVLVLCMPRPEPVALLGELLATQALYAGAAGVLVDAGIRDVDELRRLGLPVWTRWVTAAGADKGARGAIDVPVTVGGTVVAPGDVVVCDADGAVVVAADRVGTVLARSRDRAERERDLLAKYRGGALSYDLYGMRAEDERHGT